MNNQANSKLKLFINLLNGIFELDKSDLDFGIYRVMNIRKAEIEKFLSEDLKEKVRETLSPFVKDTSEIERSIAEIERDCNRYQIDINTSVRADEYNMLKKQLKEGVDITALETDVYSALYTFFSRYYVEGDFISRRLYKEQDKLYAIPYNGEEVKLYWVNYDQYYIKTTENFKDYTFISDDYTIHFRLIDATTEQDNNKESGDSKRVFMLYTENDNNPDIKTFEYNEEKKELIIRFVFDVPEDKKKNYAQENYTIISAKIISDYKQLMIPLLRNISSDPKKPKTLIQKHLESYVAKNTFDYFIHKDLRGFLTRELDFYIKNEIIHLDDIDTVNEQRVETYLAKVKAIKRVGKIIIDFLAQIEEFQKKLWLKKKFVIETNWCITLDKIDESFYPEIIKNKEQIKEWINLYHIDEIEGNLTDIAFTDPLTIEFLKQNKNLIIDTKNFSTDFRDRLIASFDNLDDQTDGLMIYSENFQALNLLQEKYRGKINCIYADPPYNSKSSEILYKNSFKHSSWLSFMADRMLLAAQLKNNKAALITAIDENEVSNLLQLYNSLFPLWEKSCISIVHNPAGVQGDNFSYSHEYAVFGFEKYKHIIGKTQRDEQSEEAFRDWGGTCARSLAQNCFYPIYVKDNKIIGFGDVCDDDFHPGSSNIHRNGIIEVYPIGDDGQERKWVFARDSVEKIKNNLRVKEKTAYIQYQE